MIFVCVAGDDHFLTRNQTFSVHLLYIIVLTQTQFKQISHIPDHNINAGIYSTSQFGTTHQCEISDRRILLWENWVDSQLWSLFCFLL